MSETTKQERLQFVRSMIAKLRQSLLDGLEADSMSSAIGSASYNREKMEERLKKYEAEEMRLVSGVSISTIYTTADMRGGMG